MLSPKPEKNSIDALLRLIVRHYKDWWCKDDHLSDRLKADFEAYYPRARMELLKELVREIKNKEGIR